MKINEWKIHTTLTFNHRVQEELSGCISIAGGKEKHFSMDGDRSIQEDITKLSLDEFNNIDAKYIKQKLKELKLIVGKKFHSNQCQ